MDWRRQRASERRGRDALEARGVQRNHVTRRGPAPDRDGLARCLQEQGPATRAVALRLDFSARARHCVTRPSDLPATGLDAAERRALLKAPIFSDAGVTGFSTVGD